MTIYLFSFLFGVINVVDFFFMFVQFYKKPCCFAK